MNLKERTNVTMKRCLLKYLVLRGGLFAARRVCLMDRLDSTQILT